MNKKTLFFGFLIAFFSVTTWWMWKQLNLRPLERTTLHLSLDNNVDSLDPAKAFSDDSLVLAAQVLEPLYQYHYLKRPYEIQPLLAETLPVMDKTGTVVTIRIRPKIFFHPHEAFKGARELVAEDFVTQLKRLALPSLNSPGRSFFAGIIEGFEEFALELGDDWKKIKTTKLKGVQSLDERTLVITLKKPEPNLIYFLAMNFAVPIPWELVEFYKNDLGNMLVGTGPYVYRGMKESTYQMTRNAQYRDEFYPTSGDRYANVQKLLTSSKERIPFIDTVTFSLLKEDDRWNRFMEHEIDLINVPKTYIPRLYGADGELSADLKKLDLRLKHFPSLANRWYSFNMRDPVFGKNANLRFAVAYAIDYTKYIQVLSQNTNLRANSLLVPGISGYMPAEDFKLRHDPELAKDYIKKAGYSDPTKIPEIVYSTRGTQPIQILEAEFIKEQLESVGFRVRIEKLEFTDFLKRGRAGELQFFTDNWFFDYPDGENIVQLLVSDNAPGINKSGYNNPEVDALYAELRQTAGQEKREKIFHAIEKIVFRDLPWIPMMYESSFVLHHPEIKNFRKSSLIRNYVKYLKIEN